MKKSVKINISLLLVFMLALVPFAQPESPQVQATEEGSELVQQLNQMLNNDPILQGGLQESVSAMQKQASWYTTISGIYV